MDISYNSLFGVWKYHDGTPVYWIKHKFNYDEGLDVMKAWCIETYGTEMNTRVEPEWRWLHMFDKFIFRTEADRLMFSLRWA